MKRRRRVFALRAAAAAVLGAFSLGAYAQVDVQRNVHVGLERALKVPLEIVWLRGEVRSEAWAGNPRPGVALQDCTKAGGPRQGCGVTWRPPTCFLVGSGSQSDQTCVSLSLLNGANARFLAGERRAPRSGVYILPPETQSAEPVRAPSGQVLLAAGHAVYLMDATYPGIIVEVRAPVDQPMSLGNLAAMDIGQIFALLLKQPGGGGRSEPPPVRAEPVQVAAVQPRIETPAVLVEVAAFAETPAEPKLETPAVLVEVAMLSPAPVEAKLDTPPVLIEVAMLSAIPVEPKLDTPPVLIEVAMLSSVPAEPKLETPAVLVEVPTSAAVAAQTPAASAVTSASDIQRMRAEVEAEIARDRERLAQSLQGRAPAKRFVFGT